MYGRLECDTLYGRLELNMVEGEVVIFQVPCCWSQHKCRLKLAPTCVSPKVYCAHSASDDNTHGAAAEAQSVRLVPQVVQWVYVASCSTRRDDGGYGISTNDGGTHVRCNCIRSLLEASVAIVRRRKPL